MTTVVAWRRFAVVSFVLVMIPLPLILLTRVGVYGLAGALAATAGWAAFALLYWWPLGALHLVRRGNRIARWSIAFVCSVPLFVVALWLAYAGVGSRFAPTGLADWGVYLSNTPWWFLATLGLSAVTRREGRVSRVVLRSAVVVLVLSTAGALAFTWLCDAYRWPAAGPIRWRIVNVHLVNVDDGRIIDGYHLWVDRNRIAALVPAQEDTATTLAFDAGGRFLMPGLIDAHMHLAVPVEGGTLAFGARHFLESLVTNFAPNRRDLLRAGVTTVRDVGGSAILTAQLRRRINYHELLGPRVFTVARLVTSPDGHPAGTIWTRELRREGAIEVGDSATLITGLEKDLRTFHPDGVKLIYGTIGRARTRLDPSLLRVATNWALAHELWVAVHAEKAAEVAAAVLVGATTVEHVGSIEDLPDSLISAIVSRRPWLDATLGEWRKGMQLAGRDSADIRIGLRDRLVRVARLREAGARFIVGTDAPLVPYGSGLHDELALLRLAGFANAELVRMATANNADALHAGGELGRLRVGYRADMILVDANPLEDIGVMRTPRWVVRDGQVVYRRDGPPAAPRH